MRCILGLDTSNYTTSVCAISAEDGTLLAEHRQLLPVKSGERGLRQSDALFFHVQRLPTIMGEVMAEIGRLDVGRPIWEGVGVSVRPRPLSTSYMPAFIAGVSFASTFASTIGIPMVGTSHQEGHLAAAEYFLTLVPGEPFLAVHLSGGTSDVLLVRPTKYGYHIEVIGEGSDLHVGQFVDRVGVALGLPFPAGPSLERMAREASTNAELRFGGRVHGAELSFSGPCSAALRAVDRGEKSADIAMAVQSNVANSVAKAVRFAHSQFPRVKACVIVGGVASNEWIRNQLGHRLTGTCPKLNLHFAPARYSSDNALGVARIAGKFLSSSI